MERENDYSEENKDSRRMVTPDENRSENNSTSEDMSISPSEDRSPMLTPNTTQEWINENIETVRKKGGIIRLEDNIKESNLEGNTIDFMHRNLEENVEFVVNEEEAVPEEGSVGHTEQSLASEDQHQEIIEEVRRDLSLELSTQTEIEASEAVLEIEEVPSNAFEEKTKIWLNDEFSNLVKMFPVRTFQEAVNIQSTAEEKEKLEKKIQSWVNSSVRKKQVDRMKEKSERLQKCEIMYCTQKPKVVTDEIQNKRDISDSQIYSPQIVTVKFLINNVQAFTCAFEIDTLVRDIKEKLSSTFKCQPVDLQLVRKGVALSDSVDLAKLGVEPYGTVEIEVKAKGSLKTESMYDVPIVPDVITVRVESATEEARDVVIEIENRCIIKPYIGGYRHKETGLEYHHAFTQTAPLFFSASAYGKNSRDTQTAEFKESVQNTTYDVGTQMCKEDHYIPCQNDRILQAGKYRTAEELQRCAHLDRKAIVIQRHWRGCMARRRFAKMKKEHQEFLFWEKEEGKRASRERDERIRKELVRKIFPRTRADYEMLYAMVENWRKAEVRRISSMETVAPKKAEFCLLLKKEIESLNTIERYRLELKKEKIAKKELSILEKCATPVTWIGYKGKEVSMETVHIQRAKELKELYYIMCQDNVSTKERIELLISLKYALKSYNPMMTNELISLFERECNCLLRGVKTKDLCTLRQRTQKLFIELMKDPEFNPEAAKHIIFDWKANEGKMHFCKQCQRLKPFNEFAIFAKTQKLNVCMSCTWTDEIARSRIDLEPYRFMIRALRRDERRRKCFSSVAFIMQDKDFYNLIVNIWHCRSLLSEVKDLYKLCLGRWDVTKDWTPWNCVLLSDVEMRAHLGIRNLQEAYAEHFIADVGYKHRLAELQFSHLYKFDKKYVGTGKWFAVKDTRGHNVRNETGGI
ncbi:hypothetical protein ANN_06605 [Periplaneta americana]|uniref:Ubiquitin-like domain-containing protein n=1 Tax=Periplaneta americana TaxID=6978 RepID=A0ABQ8TE09_PERAM|nr:hypothetical protein ANN_06605 [Periplaneta americana]